MRNRYSKALFLLIVVSGLETECYGNDRVDLLKPLIGRWKGESKSATFSSEFRWALGGSFIEHDQKVVLLGKEHEVKEIIGWDPRSQSLKGWIFSRDWIAESKYVRKQDHDEWSIEVVVTRRDGTKSTKRKTLRVIGDQMQVSNENAPLKSLRNVEFVRKSEGSAQIKP